MVRLAENEYKYSVSLSKTTKLDHFENDYRFKIDISQRNKCTETKIYN